MSSSRPTDPLRIRSRGAHRSLPPGSTPRRLSWGPPALAALLALALSSGCGVTVPDPISRQSELDADLAGAERGRSPLDDYWSESLGPYLASDALRGYWLTGAEDRFGDYGHRLLEATLRQELLSRHAGDLTPEEQERLAELPTYDAAEHELSAILRERRGR